MHAVAVKKSVLPSSASKDEFERICAILLPDRPLDDDEDEFDPPAATMEMLSRYHAYLLAHLQAGIELTGIDVFPWEERFYFGHGSEKEHAAMKEKNCSSEDKVTLVRLADFNEMDGLLVEVKRRSDSKHFLLPLADLEACKKRSSWHQLVDDYSVWFANFRC